MKWLSGGLTFVNFATVCGLIIGMIFGGLSLGVALAALVLGAAFAFLAYLKTTNSKAEDNASNGIQSAFANYRKLPIWILAAFFTIFAFRSFVWLLFVDGSELKIQSPLTWAISVFTSLTSSSSPMV